MLIHKAGTLMGKADALSRRADHKEGVENDNKDVVLLKPEYLKVQAMHQGHLLIEGAEEPLLAKIHKSRDLNEAVIKAVKELKKSSTRNLCSEEWSKEQGLILF